MAIQFVTSNNVLSVNGEFLTYPLYPQGITKNIPCRSTVAGVYWLIPRTQGNRVIGWQELTATDATKPSPDAQKVLRLKDALDANTEYEIAVGDSDCITTNSFIDNCNGCCGDTPVMASLTVPSPILQLPPNQPVDSDGTRHFTFPFPSNPNGLLYAIPFPWFNGAAPSPPYAPTGITTAALFVTWANTNWGEYGTWTSAGDIVSLANDDSDTIPLSLAGMQISITPKTWCFTLTSFSTPAAINGIQFGTGATFTFPPFMLTNTNQVTLINAIKKFLPESTFTVSSNHLQLTTVQATPKLKNGASTIATAVAGTC
jgi:hypothetical protein